MEKTTFFELSDRWPEPLKWAYRLRLNIYATLVAIFGATLFDLWQGEKMLPAYLASAAIYITGRLVDSVVCLKVAETIKKVESFGIKTDIEETNPYLSKKPTKQEVFGRIKTSIDASYLVPGIIFPPIGAMVGLLSIGAAIKDNKLARELNKKIKALR